MVDFEAAEYGVSGLSISFHGVDFLVLGEGEPAVEKVAKVSPEVVPLVAAGPSLPEGARARIEGLSMRADLNGLPCTLVEYHLRQQRWQIRFDDGAECMLDEAFLQLVDIRQAARGLQLLHRADAAHIYILHLGVDLVDEALTSVVIGTSVGHICAVLHDAEADEYVTLPRLADLFVKRILEEYWSKSGFEYGPIALAASSFGATLAHEVAIGLEQAGVLVEVTFFGFEWLEAATRLLAADDRDWMGEGVESVLLFARSIGAHAWAESEEALAIRMPPQQRDSDEMAMRLFWDNAAPLGVTQADFQWQVSNLTSQYERLNTRMDNFTPVKTFEGRVRFVEGVLAEAEEECE